MTLRCAVAPLDSENWTVANLCNYLRRMGCDDVLMLRELPQHSNKCACGSRMQEAVWFVDQDYLRVRVRAWPSAQVMIFGAGCASLGRSVRSSPARTGDA
jgi:hypothetical protein